jgi:hypothetical protein
MRKASPPFLPIEGPRPLPYRKLKLFGLHKKTSPKPSLAILSTLSKERDHQNSPRTPPAAARTTM